MSIGLPMSETPDMDMAFDTIWSKTVDLQVNRGLISDIKEAEDLVREFNLSQGLVAQN